MSGGDPLQRVAAATGPADARLAAARRAARGAIGGGRTGESLLHRLFDAIAGWIGELFGRLSAAGAAGPIGWVVLAALVVAALLLARRLLTRRPRAAARPQPAVVGAGFEEARAHAVQVAETDPREGLRLLYSALLDEVGRRHGWRRRPGSSNWWFVRRLGAATPAGSALAECTRLFERRVYGSAPTDAGDVAQLDRLATGALG